MSQYLQRLVQPSLPAAPGAVRTSVASRSQREAFTSQALPGVQEIHHTVEVCAPGSRTSRGRADSPAAIASRSSNTPAAPTANTRAAIMSDVTRWLAGAPPVTAVPPAGHGVEAVDAEAAGVPGSGHGEGSHPAGPTDLRTDGTQRAGRELTATNGSGSMQLAPSTALAAQNPLGAWASADAASSATPWPAPASAHPQAHPQAQTRAFVTAPARMLPAEPSIGTASRSHAGRKAQATRQVEVHIGSIALTVKAPASPAPSPPASATPVAAGTRLRPMAEAAEPLRFSPARHHLRWS